MKDSDLSVRLPEPQFLHPSTERSDPPVWVSVLDGTGLGLLVVATCVAAFGGFHTWVGPIEISARSSWRIWLLAMLLLGGRHVMWRQQWLHERIPIVLKRIWTDRPLRATLPMFVWSRIGVFLVAFFAVSTIGYPVKIPFVASENEFVNLPARWDAGWYLGIAQNGYRYSSRIAAEGGQQNIAFFPAYPVFMRLAAKLVGVDRQQMLDPMKPLAAIWLWAGVVVSLAALLWALLYLHRMMRAFAGEEAAVATVQMALAYPMAFIYNVPYTESLLLLSTVAAFYHFGRGQLGRAFAWGLLAGLTRPNGCFLSVPLGFIALARCWPSGGRFARFFDRLNVRPDAPRRGFLLQVLAAAAPGLGMLLFSASMYTVAGDPFIWAKTHAAWGRAYAGLAPLFAPVNAIAALGLYGYSHVAVYEILNVIPFAIALVLAIPITRRFGLAYAILIPLTVFPPLTAGGWLSIGRVTLVLFPVYAYLGLVPSSTQRAGILTIFAFLQAFGATLFFTWRPFY
jgi:hypothetical protein